MADNSALSTQHSALLSAYLTTANQSLHTLAAQTGRSLPDLLAWFASPATQEALAAYDLAQSRARAAAAEPDRLLALATLRQIVTTCRVTTEVRRAATTLLRASTPVPHAPAHSAPRTQALSPWVPPPAAQIAPERADPVPAPLPTSAPHPITPPPAPPQRDNGRAPEPDRSPIPFLVVSPIKPVHARPHSTAALLHHAGAAARAP